MPQHLTKCMHFLSAAPIHIDICFLKIWIGGDQGKVPFMIHVIDLTVDRTIHCEDPHIPFSERSRGIHINDLSIFNIGHHTLALNAYAKLCPGRTILSYLRHLILIIIHRNIDACSGWHIVNRNHTHRSIKRHDLWLLMMNAFPFHPADLIYRILSEME